ncbi:helicase [Synechococcus sp. CBW1004]|uniref:helicase n=1 Tax=Synechococcus sp. CBW1004 TaxID=1353136 RepID=UPI0018CE8598|nr:helicase [Synechococcus sp. CBW1004]QPN62927.1 helicase [Synechococcus sp. CBW1004]
MLEARAHQQLKALLRGEGAERWPHHLTLSRLVARSLRRADHTLVRLSPGTDPSWWIGLLVPLALSDDPVALVVSDAQRQRLLQRDCPRLAAAGLELACWQGRQAPVEARIWLLSHSELLLAWRDGLLGKRQLVIPEAERLAGQLRQAMGVTLEPKDWETLRQALPSASGSLLDLHRRLSARILCHPRQPDLAVPISAEEEAPLRQLLQLLSPLPEPWPQWLATPSQRWTSWAQVDPTLLQWRLYRQPLDPLAELSGLLRGRGAVLVGELGGAGSEASELPADLGFAPQVSVALGDPPLSDPLPLYAPLRQPLPNSPLYGQHLLDQCRRLVLGQAQLTVVLLDDATLRRRLASGLAAEFGRRVDEESTAPEENGVICCRWSWWLEHQERLPHPGQVVVALLPIASLEDPLTAARVAALRQEGRDWFRELLLPEALNRLQRGLAGLRRQGGRLAVLDGRLRGRSWGRLVGAALEPWVELPRLLPG